MHVAHSDKPEAFPEVFSDELTSVVRHDWRFGLGGFFTRLLKSNFDVRFFHRLADFAVNNKSAVAIKGAAHEIEPADLVWRLVFCFEVGLIGGVD